MAGIDSTQPHTVLRGHTEYISSIEYLTDDQLLSGSGDMSVKLWDLKTGQKVYDFVDRNLSDVTSLCCHPYFPNVFLSASLNTVKVWDTRHKYSLQSFSENNAEVNSIKYDIYFFSFFYLFYLVFFFSNFIDSSLTATPLWLDAKTLLFVSLTYAQTAWWALIPLRRTALAQHHLLLCLHILPSVQHRSIHLTRTIFITIANNNIISNSQQFVPWHFHLQAVCFLHLMRMAHGVHGILSSLLGWAHLVLVTETMVVVMVVVGLDLLLHC